jgi:Family of unknown function (DUF6157)
VGHTRAMAAEHSTNYVDTFIEVAEDCPVEAATEPPSRATPSVAELTYRMIAEHPYEHTSDDVVFTVWADRHDLPPGERQDARAAFFAKGQPCLRASDLGKRYGWGIHADAGSRVALYAVESPDYATLAGGEGLDGEPLTVKKAMRSTRR